MPFDLAVSLIRPTDEFRLGFELLTPVENNTSRHKFDRVQHDGQQLLDSLLAAEVGRLEVDSIGSISGPGLNFDRGLSWPPSRLLKDLSILVSDDGSVPLSL